MLPDLFLPAIGLLTKFLNLYFSLLYFQRKVNVIKYLA